MSSIDYINGLPDCLLSHILSFVSTKEAASTSVLAKRWRYMFALTPDFDFDDSVYLNPEKRSKSPKSFVDFVDRVLFLHHDVPLIRFSLTCKDVHPANITSWLLKVMERGVLNLDLHISSEMGFSLPSEMFVSETLVKLKIRVSGDLTIDKAKDVYLTIKDKDVFLPKVKTLSLHTVIVEKSVFRKLLSGCQALEILAIANLFVLGRSCSVSHNTLKALLVYRSRTFDYNHESVSFSTPNLVCLMYYDTIADKYPKVEFNSLRKAKLDLRMTKDQLVKAKFTDDDRSLPVEMAANATNFFMGICNVKVLHLFSDTLEVLNYCCKPIPKFNNLVHLTIQTDLEVSWESLPALLKNCPKLETLVFEGLHYGDINRTPWEGTSEWLSSSPVKTLKVLKFGAISCNINDMDKQMDMIKYFVETMPNLEEVVLYCDTRGEDYLSIASTAFRMLQKVASTKCKIRVVPDKISKAVGLL